MVGEGNQRRELTSSCPPFSATAGSQGPVAQYDTKANVQFQGPEGTGATVKASKLDAQGTQHGEAVVKSSRGETVDCTRSHGIDTFKPRVERTPASCISGLLSSGLETCSEGDEGLWNPAER